MSIVTSRTQHGCSLDCMREVYWGYHFPKAKTDGRVDGLQRRVLSIPLTTGIFVHRGLARLLNGNPLAEVVAEVEHDYRTECAKRSLEHVEGAEQRYLIDEQAALITALLTAWTLVRLPVWLAEYDIVTPEEEMESALDGGVVAFLSRPDAVLKRRSDGSYFILSFKTAAEPQRLRGYQADLQSMTEVFAVEDTLGITVAGVIVEGLLKGKRLKDKDDSGHVTGVRQSSPLIYGYKFDGNPPFEPLAYDYQYKRAKGWRRFPVWQENFAGTLTPGEAGPLALSPVETWARWLPREMLEAQFVTLPAVLRQRDVVDSVKLQIEAQACSVSERATQVSLNGASLDVYFPQNPGQCERFGEDYKCSFYDICWTRGVANDPVGSGLYIAREPNHPKEVQNDG